MLSNYYYYNSKGESEASQDPNWSLSPNWDHSYGALTLEDIISSTFVTNRPKPKKISIRRMDATMELFPDLLDYDSNDDHFSIANAPTPYLANDLIEGMNDLNDINDSDLIGFNNCDNNEVIIDENNNKCDTNSTNNVVIDANNEQIEFSVTHNDIQRMNANKRRNPYVDDEENEEDNEDYEEAQSESISFATTRKRGKKYERSQNGKKANKCMSRNAIAARENREKKKLYIKELEKKLDKATKDNRVMSTNMTALTKHNAELEHEVTYLRAVVANVPQIAALINHMSSAPNMQLIGTSLNAGGEGVANALKKPMVSNISEGTAVRKSNRIAAKMENPGICFHINGNNNMSLELCSKCSDASIKYIKVKKEK